MGLLDRLRGRGDEDETASSDPLAEYEEQRARATAAGSFRGRHFTEWADLVDKLRLDGKLDDSLSLAYECIEATERQNAVDGTGIAPGYFHDAAVVLRAQKKYGEEVAVLERYLSRGSRHPEFRDRLKKAIALRDAEQNATPPACPACGTVLEDPPKSKGKCPSCKEPLVMRTVDGQRVAMTIDQATAQSVATKAEKAKAKFLLRLGYFDVTEKDWDLVTVEQTARLGRPTLGGDVYWQIANDIAVRAEHARNWSLAGRVRSDMTRFLVEESRDWVTAAEIAQRDWVQDALQHYEAGTEMILIACPCEPCQPDHLAVRNLAAFAEAWPLPHPNCERPPCRCKVNRKTY